MDRAGAKKHDGVASGRTEGVAATPGRALGGGGALFWVAVAGVAALYYGAARLGLAIGSVEAHVSPVWPAAGIALAALLLLGPRAWPAIPVVWTCTSGSARKPT